VPAARAPASRHQRLSQRHWCRLHERQRQDINDYPNVKRWFERIAARPAVAKDMKRLEDIVEGFSPDSWEVAFGGRQYRQA
jgi:glutathione S-transferase